jgi:hypothetical protein
MLSIRTLSVVALLVVACSQAEDAGTSTDPTPIAKVDKTKVASMGGAGVDNTAGASGADAGSSKVGDAGTDAQPGDAGSDALPSGLPATFIIGERDVPAASTAIDPLSGDERPLCQPLGYEDYVLTQYHVSASGRVMVVMAFGLKSKMLKYLAVSQNCETVQVISDAQYGEFHGEKVIRVINGEVWEVDPVPNAVPVQVTNFVAKGVQLGVTGLAFGAGKVWYTKRGVVGTFCADYPGVDNEIQVFEKVAAKTAITANGRKYVVSAAALVYVGDVANIFAGHPVARAECPPGGTVAGFAIAPDSLRFAYSCGSSNLFIQDIPAAGSNRLLNSNGWTPKDWR